MISGENGSVAGADFPLAVDIPDKAAPRTMFGKKSSSGEYVPVSAPAVAVPAAPPPAMTAKPAPSGHVPLRQPVPAMPVAAQSDALDALPPLPSMAEMLEPSLLVHEEPLIPAQTLIHHADMPRMAEPQYVELPREITREPLRDDEMTEAALKAIATACEEPEPVAAKPVGRGIKKAHVPLDLGIITPLMRDDSISDILINGAGPIFVERGGLLEPTRLKFNHEDEVIDFAHRILSALDRDIDPLRPLADARLPDGSRVNIIMPPMAVDGTTISIRKFPAHKITLDTMVQSGTLTEGIGSFLKACSAAKLNIIVAGGTGAGKTTLLNSLSQYISHKERIVTIEDSAELQLQQPHVVRLETKRPTRQGQRDEEVNVRDLVINSLRMRPDRIIVGEVRGGEAFDMLQAMNTGHEGSMATLHANTPRDALSRLENMINMADMGLSQKFIRQQIVSALSIIVQTNRFKDGSRRITHITEVVGLENEIIVLQDLFTYQVKGEDENGKVIGQYEWGGVIPRSKELAEAARVTGLFTAGKR